MNFATTTTAVLLLLLVSYSFSEFDENEKFCNFTGNRIPISLSPNLTRIHTEAIRIGLETLYNWTCLSFVPVDNSDDLPPNYFRYTLHPQLGEEMCRGPHASGKCRGVSKIFLNCIVDWRETPNHIRSNKTQPTAWDVGLVIHETMHSLGFSHEQQRPDRNQFVNVWPENSAFAAEMEIDYQMSMFGEPYDLHSVMHYGWDSWQKADTWEPTVLPKEKVYLGVDYDNGRNGLTATDIRKLRVAYKCVGGATVPISDPPHPIIGQHGHCEDPNGDQNSTHFILCAHRHKKGFCNTQYGMVMRTECPGSCKLCKVQTCYDMETRKCRNWKETTEGYCQSNVTTSSSCPYLCGKSCAKLGVAKSCVDWHHRCQFWAAEGSCTSNPIYMLDRDDGCLLGCGYCNPAATVLEPMALKRDFVNDMDDVATKQHCHFALIAVICVAMYLL